MLLSLALGLALVQQQGFRTDTTIAVPPGARLDLELASGGVTIRTWDRNQVRIRASHSARTTLDIRHDAGLLRIEAEGRMGMPGDVELELSVPADAAVDIEGLTVDVEAEAMRGLLRVETMDGDIRVRDAADLRLETMNGMITVAGARGRINLGTVSRDIVAAGLSGEVTAESVSGGIWLTGTESSAVAAETISGDVVFQGAVRAGGSYTLASHSGNLTFGLPAGAGATVSTALAAGRLSASFTLPGGETRSRRRQLLQFGDGSATVELESFSGNIRLVRPDEVPARTATPGRDRRPGASHLEEALEDGLGGLLEALEELGLPGHGLPGLDREIRREVKDALKLERRWRSAGDAAEWLPPASIHSTEN